MTRLRRALDDRLLDLLGAVEGRSFEGPMWRVVQTGRSVVDGSRGSGRWNTTDMSVLYGSTDPDGAIAEIHFHISRGQSVFPTKMKHDLHELSVRIPQTLVLADMDQLKALGLQESRYKEILYGRTQEIAAAAAFLGFDGLIAPSARWSCDTLALFLTNVDLDDVKQVSKKPIDWAQWRKKFT